MLDQLLELFERDRRSSTAQKGGLRGKLGSLMGGDADESYRTSSRDSDPRRSERSWDDDRDDDDDDDGRRTRRSQRRDPEPFDFGD